MTVKDACSVLGVKEDTPLKEIKTKYRKLMLIYHPDADCDKDAGSSNAYKAALINEAYDVLSKRKSVFKPFHETDENRDSRSDNSDNWKGPENEKAYAAREILQPVEDSMGNKLATICVAKGKYMWTEDEEFSLFLLSIYNLSKSLLDKREEKAKRGEPTNKTAYQAELAYLLARQFINGTEALKFVVGEGTAAENGDILYLVNGMLEKEKTTRRLAHSEFLYPEKVSNHRLYLKDGTGKSMGYLSFKDDRLYYIIVPLFEARKVKIMIMQNPESFAKNKNTDLLVWIKLISDNKASIELDDNVKIRRLLEMYDSEMRANY